MPKCCEFYEWSLQVIWPNTKQLYNYFKNASTIINACISYITVVPARDYKFEEATKCHTNWAAVPVYQIIYIDSSLEWTYILKLTFKTYKIDKAYFIQNYICQLCENKTLTVMVISLSLILNKCWIAFIHFYQKLITS